MSFMWFFHMWAVVIGKLSDCDSLISFSRGRRLRPKPARRLSASGLRGRNTSRRKSRSDWRGRR